MPASLICVLVSIGFLVTASPGPPAPHAPGAPAAGRARIELEFLADGRCTVSATGDAFHSKLTYTPQAPASSTSELRCAIPPVPAGAAVDLTVMLPRGPSPSPAGEEPPLRWSRRDYRWIGIASLKTAPLVVRIPESGNHTARRALAMWGSSWATIVPCVIVAFAIAGWLWSRDRKVER
jgi:hypothetical protein